MTTRDGAESMQEVDPETIKDVAETLSILVVGGAYAAMDNYGTGSLMDKNNPALNEYQNSGLWNPSRPDATIRGRPQGSYVNIFGEEDYSRGFREGQDLEKAYRAGGKMNLWLLPPSHALETAARWMKTGYIQETVRRAIAVFDFSPYFIVSK